MEVSWRNRETRLRVFRLPDHWPRVQLLDAIVLVVAIVAFALAVVAIAMLVDPGRG
jgi:hypothetical protein